jgi:hydrogenase-4 component E
MDIVLVALILSNFLLLGSSRLRSCIRIAALQGIMAGLLPMVTVEDGFSIRLAALGMAVIILKGFVFPRLLNRAIRDSAITREVQPFIGYTASLIAGILALSMSFWLDGRLNLLLHSASAIMVPVALSMMFTGLFLVVARRMAITQVIGYLVLENGIYALGIAIVRNMPFLVELGVLMDVFVAVFVMGIAIYRINSEFDHIDSHLLAKLKG